MKNVLQQSQLSPETSQANTLRMEASRLGKDLAEAPTTTYITSLKNLKNASQLKRSYYLSFEASSFDLLP